MSESYLVIELNQQPVELCKLLKIANLVSGGGEAKVVISEGYVLLNGEVEYQKRKKVYHQDVIEFNGEVVQLIINESLAEPSTKAEPLAGNKVDNKSEQTNSAPKTKTAKKKAKAKKNLARKNANAAVDEQEIFQENQPKKRRPISF